MILVNMLMIGTNKVLGGNNTSLCRIEDSSDCISQQQQKVLIEWKQCLRSEEERRRQQYVIAPEGPLLSFTGAARQHVKRGRGHTLHVYLNVI